MLDQNTDRMWYVIGAVIIGAAVIFIANGTLPSLFASVSESFNESSSDATDVVSDIRPQYANRQYLTLDDVALHGSVFNPTLSGGRGVYDAGEGFSTWMISGFRLANDVMELAYGEIGTLGFDIWIPEEYDGTYASVDINMYPTNGASWAGNDNDNVANRLLNGSRAGLQYIPLNAGEWNRVEVTFENTDSRNTNEVSLRNNTSFGLRRTSDDVDQFPEIPVKLRNVYIEILD